MVWRGMGWYGEGWGGMVRDGVVYTYTMEYYSALKTKDILTCATECINLKDIMLSEISSHKYNLIPLTCSTCSSQIHRDRK